MRKSLVALLSLLLITCGDATTDPASSEAPATPESTATAATTPVAVPATEVPQGEVRSITVGGMGSEYAEPVRCVLDIGVTVRRSTVESASRVAAESAQAMTTALIAAGVETRYIQTSDFSIGTYYEDWPEIAGYETQLGYRVTMPNVDGVADVLASAIAAGGDDVRAWGIRFEADPAGLMETAREQAWADVAGRAEALAALAGEPLGAVLDAHEKVLVSTPQGMYQGGEGDSASFDIPVSPGQSGVVVLLTVSFAIG